MKKTDYQICIELQKYILTTFQVDKLSHKNFYKQKDGKNDEKNYVRVYIDGKYVSLEVRINNKETELNLYQSGNVDTPDLEQGNFKDIEFPNVKKISRFVMSVLKVEHDRIKEEVLKEKKGTYKKIKTRVKRFKKIIWKD